jgi:hypothetical protein
MRIDWNQVESLLTPLLAGAVCGPPSAARMAANVRWLGEGLEPFDLDKARLLCWFCGLRDKAREPHNRRHWVKPLREAGVSLQTQTWLWIALQRYLHTPETNEEKAAHDAWALDQVGAIGLARAIAAAGRKGQPILPSLKDYRRQLEEAVFLTVPGRRIGIRRIVIARRFLKELEEEGNSED